MHRDDVSALPVEGLVCVRPCAGVSEHSPFAHDGISHGQFGAIGIPSGASAGEHVVFSVMLEHCGCFACHADEAAHESAVGACVIVCQAVDVHGLVFFRGCELIGCAVVIDKQCLVARHAVVGAESVQVRERPGR